MFRPFNARLVSPTDPHTEMKLPLRLHCSE